jgi:hypothetical protein
MFVKHNLIYSNPDLFDKRKAVNGHLSDGSNENSDSNYDLDTDASPIDFSDC